MSDDRHAGGGGEALTALRDIWSVTGQTGTELDQRLGAGHSKVCRNMARIGFGGMGADHTGDTNIPVDDDIRQAWRSRLAREGKVHPHAVSVGEWLRSRTYTH